MKKYIIIGLLAACLLGTSMHAQMMISLEDAVRTAYKNNINLQAARAQEKSVFDQIGVHRSNFFPRLDLEQTIVKTNQQVAAFGTKLNQGIIAQPDFNPDVLNDPNNMTDFGTSIVVSQPVFNGGKELLGYKIAKLRHERAQWETRSAEELILFETVKTYLGAVLARESVTVSTDALTTAEKNLEMIDQRYAQGLVIRSDLLQASVHVAELRERAVTAKSQYDLARHALTTLLGDRSVFYSPSGELTGVDCPSLDLDTLIQWAHQDRPDILGLKTQEKISQTMVQLAQSPYLPDLNLRGSYDYHGDSLFSGGEDSLTLAVSFKLNLFNGTGDYYRVKKSRSDLFYMRKLIDVRKDLADLEVRNAFVTLTSAKARLAVTGEAVEQAEEGLRIITDRYAEGATGIIDLLRSELTLTNFRFKRLQASHDLLLAHSALCKAVGHLYTRWLDPEQCPVSLKQ